MPSRDSLLRQRRQLLTRLPPLEQVVRGSLTVRRLRCGKSDRCRCGRGLLHRAAYLSVTLKGGTTQQVSIPRTLQPLTRLWCGNYARWWQLVERISAINRELLRRRWVGPDGSAGSTR